MTSWTRAPSGGWGGGGEAADGLPAPAPDAAAPEEAQLVTPEQAEQISSFLNNPNFIALVQEVDWQCFLTGTGFTGLLNTALATDIVPPAFAGILSGLPNLVVSYFSTPGCTAIGLISWIEALLVAIGGGLELSNIGQVYGVVGTTPDGEQIGLTTGDPNLLTCIGVQNLIAFLGVLG